MYWIFHNINIFYIFFERQTGLVWFLDYCNQISWTNKSFRMRNKKNETVTLKKGGKEVQLDYADLRKAVLVLRAVNHKLRQRIIDLLEDGETMTVTDIYIKLRLEQSVASQHLAILRRAGVVATDRQGKFIYYSLDKERLSQISSLVEDLTS